MKTKPEHEKILIECFQRMRRHANTPRPPSWQTWLTGQYDEISEYGPEYHCGEWFGDVFEHERQRYRRAIADLERGGLLVTWCRWGRRLSHIRLTPEGEAIARELMQAQEDEPEIRKLMNDVFLAEGILDEAKQETQEP